MVWLEVNYIETLLEDIHWGGVIREAKCSSSLVKEMEFLSPKRGFKILREDLYLESTKRLKSTAVGLHTCEESIYEQ
jgi:hypothetical protein